MIGCQKNSTTIEFTPGPIQSQGRYTADPGTAGSTTLLLQVSYPTLIFSSSSEPSDITVRGGTNAAHAPQIDYTAEILLPFLHKNFGLSPKLTVRKLGYYPKGGGEVHMRITPTRGPLPAVTLTERGAVTAIRGKAYVAGYPMDMAQKIREAAVAKLTAAGYDSTIIQIDAVREDPKEAIGRGSGIVIWAETENGCRLAGSSTGLRGEDLAKLGNVAADELLSNLEHGGCVDEYLQVWKTRCCMAS